MIFNKKITDFRVSKALFYALYTVFAKTRISTKKGCICLWFAYEFCRDVISAYFAKITPDPTRSDRFFPDRSGSVFFLLDFRALVEALSAVFAKNTNLDEKNAAYAYDLLMSFVVISCLHILKKNDSRSDQIRPFLSGPVRTRFCCTIFEQIVL